MKAAVLVQYGAANKAFLIKEVDDLPVGQHQLKIRVEAFGINFADVMARKKLYADAPPLPAILGYESVGKVIEQGSSVSQNYLGKRVLAFTRFGSYAQEVITNENAIVVIDETDDAGKLLALATQYCTAYFASHVVTTIQNEDLILQHAAAGGVGLAMLELAQLRGAKIIGLVSSDEKAEFIQHRGAFAAINYRKLNYVHEVQKQFGKIDVSFNSVAGKTFKKDISLLNFGGRMVCYGAADRLKGKAGVFSTFGLLWNMGIIVPVKLLMKSQSLIGVNMLRIADHKPNILQSCMQEVYQLYMQKKINPYVGAEFKAEEIALAHEQMEQQITKGKLVLHW